MTVRVGINGFGRIGRTFVRAAFERDDLDFEVVAANDITQTEACAHLLKYDSVHGIWKHSIEVDGHDIIIDGQHRLVSMSSRNPEEIDWDAEGVDIVVESTGHFRDGNLARGHLGGSVRKVIISSPATHEDGTFVMGVNSDTYNPDTDNIISNASCTTNCLAPLLKPFLDTFGIERGLMTTIHAYTADQRLQDAKHKDLRRARAAALNMVPTTTGAAKAIGLVLPQLAGKLDGFAVRVPVADGSLTDVTVEASRAVTLDEILDVYRAAAAEGPLAGYLAYNDDPIVSRDIVGNPASCIFDAPLTRIVGTTVKLVGWYDNEWAYTNRLIDLTALVAAKL